MCSPSDPSPEPTGRATKDRCPRPRRHDRERPAGCPGRPERPAWTSPSGQVEPVEIHDLVPCGHEVAHELRLCVLAPVDLSDRAELGVGAEDQVETAAGPPRLARAPVTPLEGVLGL